jgi:hypothetical protein
MLMMQAMRSYARWLFGIAAAFNAAVALFLLFAEDLAARPLDLAPIAGSNVVFYVFTALVVALFGYAYFRVARDPVTFRPLILLGALGKLLAFVSAALPWAMGIVSWKLPLLASVDVAFAVLFLDFLRRTRHY